MGRNAQGKTNLLESIYFLALTRSHRTKTDKNLIRFEEEQLQVSGILQKRTATVPLEIDLTPKGRITKVNHLKQARLSDYIGHMNVVLFAPEDLQLVKEHQLSDVSYRYGARANQTHILVRLVKLQTMCSNKEIPT